MTIRNARGARAIELFPRHQSPRGTNGVRAAEEQVERSVGECRRGHVADQEGRAAPLAVLETPASARAREGWRPRPSRAFPGIPGYRFVVVEERRRR
jgi:hypothetical protein